ncbi:hypothetical protein [Streptomyces qinzhouensis]|uniref:Uncharacterized protein n=1 Tax=Streptomyces qinzhouensis TaxID=2599401 RepID=A0A5B8JI34_9ACTN|nr:hypothetical protein [Streptomyces qinzhouensis]QDY77450.1 hypothetical protein FQU76_13980 [Streptomyces qinzhouensis]
MTTTTLTPTVQLPGARRATTAPGAAHRTGGALHAVKVFASALFSVAVTGDYDAEAAGVRRR